MEPILIATDSERVDVCAVQDFELDMAIGYDRQDFTATFSPIGGVGGGSLLYIDGTEYGGVVDDVTSDTETGLIQCHGRTWDGILACKRILPPDGSAYRTVSGDANSVLADLVVLLDISDVFSASSETSGITVSYQFDRFVDAYEGITKMLASASAKLTMRRVSGKTVLSAEPSNTIEDEVDSDLMDFTVTSQTRTVNHLVCAGMGEGTEREVIHLYADGNGNVSQTQTFTGIDEITAFYDYNNAEGDELLTSGIEKLQEYQTQGSVEVTGVGKGEWGIGDVLVARDNASGTAVASPIVGKTVKVGPQTNWTLAVEYAVGEAARVKAEAIGRGENAYVIGGVSGVKGDAESAYRTGDVNLTPANIGALALTGGTTTGSISIKTAAIDRDAENPSSAQYANYFRMADNDNNTIGLVRSRRDADGGIYFYMGAYNGDSSNADVSNTIGIKVLRDGTRSYYVTDQAKFRSAISARPLPTVLYNNTTGTAGTVTLSQTAANFNHMRIYFRTNDGTQYVGAVDVYSPNGKTAAALSWGATSSAIYLKVLMMAISGTSITRPYNREVAIGDGSNHTFTSVSLYVVRVEAWNE